MKFRIIRPDGETRWLHSVACLMRDDADNIRAIGCITDVTHIEEQNALHPAHFPERNASAAELSSSSDVDASQIHLSDKERECLLWVSFGKTAWETAGIIGRSQRTVEFHLSNAIRKLNATNKVHAAVLAIRNGLL